MVSLYQVSPEQQVVAATEQGGDPAQQRPPRRRRQVADRAAEQSHQPRRAVALGHAWEMSLEVTDYTMNAQAVVVLHQLLGGAANDALGDVERDAVERVRRYPDRDSQDQSVN